MIITGIQKLRCLQSLTFSNNRLKYLPVQLFECRNLINLHLESNQLKFIPKEIVKLTKLSELTLSNNQLSFLNPNIWLIINNLKGDYFDNPLLCHLDPPSWLKKWPRFNTNNCITSNCLDEETMLLVIEKVKEFYHLQLVVKTGVPTLLELTMQRVYTDFLSSCSTEECCQQILKQLPKDIRSCFDNPPPCLCYFCKKPLFKWAIFCSGLSTNLVDFRCSNSCAMLRRYRE